MTAIENTIQLENAPAIKGLRFRPFRDEEDHAHIAGIENAYCAARGLPFQLSSEEIAGDLAGDENIDKKRDLLFAEVNGETVGYAWVGHYLNAEREQIFKCDNNVSLAWLDSGLNEALLKWGESRANEIAQTAPHAGPRFLQAYTVDVSPERIAMLEQSGYSVVRYGFLMVRSLNEPIPDLPLPAGIEVRPKQREHYRAIWEARNEADRDHWGHVESNETGWQSYLDWADHQPELCQVAWDAAKDEVVGEVTVTIYPREIEKFDIKRGWTEPIFVRRPYRKRGVAKALIARALKVLNDAGMDEAGLSVDAQNLTGALRLYEGMGYRVKQQTFTYRKAF